MSNTNNTVVYWDSQDPQDIGWAYRTGTDSGAVDAPLLVACLDAIRDGEPLPKGGKAALLAEYGELVEFEDVGRIFP